MSATPANTDSTSSAIRWRAIDSLSTCSIVRTRDAGMSRLIDDTTPSTADRSDAGSTAVRSASVKSPGGSCATGM